MCRSRSSNRTTYAPLSTTLAVIWWPFGESAAASYDRAANGSGSIAPSRETQASVASGE